MNVQAKSINGLGKRSTLKKPNTVSASDIIKAGGVENWAKKVGYDSQKIKMSGIITLTEEQVNDAIKTSRK